jgi:hypothetical protein
MHQGMAVATCRRLLSALAFGLCCTAACQSRSQAADDGQFGLTKVWKLHLHIPAEEFEALQPAAPAFPGFGGPAPGPAPIPAAPKAKRESERNLFGMEFPWVRAEITAAGQPPLPVSVRYAGDITYFVSAGGLKRPLMIRFGEKRDERLYGIGSLQLHAMPLDPSKAREVLALASTEDGTGGSHADCSRQTR